MSTGADPRLLRRNCCAHLHYIVRSERLLMEALQYNLLFLWFVGLDLDAPAGEVTVFAKSRDRLLAGKVATAFFELVLVQAKAIVCCPTSTSQSTVR